MDHSVSTETKKNDQQNETGNKVNSEKDKKNKEQKQLKKKKSKKEKKKKVSYSIICYINRVPNLHYIIQYTTYESISNDVRILRRRNERN